MSKLAVKLEGVGKHYRFFSLNDVHFEVPEGHIVGFIGPNGAGKSTTIRILMGLVHQDRGDVQVLGHRMPVEQARAKWDVVRSGSVWSPLILSILAVEVGAIVVTLGLTFYLQSRKTDLV